MAAIDLSHIVNRTTLSRRIFKSPVWLVASSVTLVYELKRHNVEREATLLYSDDNSSHDYRSHTHYSNTDMLIGMQTQQSVFLRNEKSYQSR